MRSLRTPSSSTARSVTLGVALSLAAVDVALADPPRVLVSEIPNDPTSLVVGATGPGASGARFWSLEGFSIRLDGSEWGLLGRTDQIGPYSRVLVHGGGFTGSVLLQEGQAYPANDIPAPWAPGETHSIGEPRWDATGRMAFAVSLRYVDGSGMEQYRGTATTWAPSAGFTTALRTGSPLGGGVDTPPAPSGDELAGSSFGWAHPFDDGRVGAFVTLDNATYPLDAAYARGTSIFRQAFVDTASGEPWVRWKRGSGATPDGQHWLGYGELSQGGSSTLLSIVYDDVVVFQEFAPIPGTTETLFATGRPFLDEAGDFYVWGGTIQLQGFVARNGVPVVWAGDPLGATPGGESWSGFRAVAGLPTGDLVVGGWTDHPDNLSNDVIAWNGQVVVREGDAVDLDGDGQADDAFVSGFREDGLYVTTDRVIHAFVELGDAGGNALGSALIVVDLCQGFAKYGAGCAGTGGHVPTLGGNGCTLAGETIGLSIGKGLGGSTATLLVGLAPAAAPLGGGCQALLLPAPVSLVLPLAAGGPGQGGIGIAAPLSPVLEGSSLYLQAFVADAASSIGYAASNGLRIDVR